MEQKFEDFFLNDRPFTINENEALAMVGFQETDEEQDLIEYKIDGILKLREYFKSLFKSNEAVKQLDIELKSQYVFLKLNKQNSSKETRKLMRNLLSSEDIKRAEITSRLKGLELSEEELKHLESKIEIPIEYDEAVNQLNEELIFQISLKNKFFIEYCFYLRFHKIFKESFPQYWYHYIDFIKLCHRHLSELFIKKIDFDQLDVKAFQDKIRYYRRIVNLELSEIKQ
ncbi:hypothetical protein ABMA67_02495 [Halobacteriovorax sp. RZ-3]|uniref:hypothetical protein n=1 Tax=Halobacteriovorax sp. RZ-3 TaxID=3157720 RepID=UPI0037205CDF